jgi:hypothetical protein
VTVFFWFCWVTQASLVQFVVSGFSNKAWLISWSRQVGLGLNTKTGCPPTPVSTCSSSPFYRFFFFCVGYLFEQINNIPRPIYPVFSSSHVYRRIGLLLSITYCSRNLSTTYRHLDVTFLLVASSHTLRHSQAIQRRKRATANNQDREKQSL